MPRILFVCLGNICRSPLAEGILRRQAEEAGIELFVDSAGTGDWHIGQLPDPRAVRVGQSLGCRMTMRARQVRSEDFEEFDLILAMDNKNVRTLEGWPGSQQQKIRLTRTYDPTTQSQEVPDPYYGETTEFEDVAAMLERACRGILAELPSSPCST